MGKAAAVIEVLPSVYGADDPHKLVAEVVRSLAVPLEAADGELYDIQRAHRLQVAPTPRDVVHLAAALDLDQFHFEDLLTAPVDRGLRLEIMRDRVRRVAALHLDGLGTPWAVVAAATLFLAGRLVAEEEGGPLLRQLDDAGLSHIGTIEFEHAEGRPRESIVLHENPFRRLKVDPAPRWPGDGWPAENGDPEVGPLRIAIRGVHDRTVLPTVFSPDLPGGIVFNGVVPHGETLVIDADDGATLGDRDVTPWLLVYRGGMFDYVDDGAASAIEDGETREPFLGGDTEDAPTWRRRRPKLPRLPLGRSDWHFTVNVGTYDGDDFDAAVFLPPEFPVGTYDQDPPLDQSVYDLPPSADVGMAWDERIPCAFKLLLPDRIPPPRPAHEGAVGPPVDHAGRVATILPRFRAAGITAYTDTTAGGWVLGRSVLRDTTAGDGAGIDFHSARLVDRRDEVLVPFDPAAATATSRQES
jgi:hypothetical protein